MASCSNCSRTIKSTAKFCIYCGARRTIQRKTSSQPVQKKKVRSNYTPTQGRDFRQNIQDFSRKQTTPRMKVETKKSIPTRKKLKKIDVYKPDELYQFNQRIQPRLKTIERAVNNYKMRDEFSRSDASQVQQFAMELKEFSKHKEFSKSKYKGDAISLMELTLFVSMEIFEDLTEEINNQELIDLREKWSGFKEKIDERKHTISLLDRLEQQNKIINKQIDSLERIFGRPSYENIFKSQMYTKYNGLRNFYLKRLGPSIDRYFTLIEHNQYTELFNSEIEMLNKLKLYVDPNIPTRVAVSTKDISNLCFEFLETRGINATTLRLNLAELEEELKQKNSIIDRVKIKYKELMWDFINNEQLAIQTASFSERKYKERTKIEDDDHSIGDAVDNLNKLSKLRPLKELDHLKKFNQLNLN